MPAEHSTWDLIVIGGGAAGFFGAIKAAEQGGRVLLLEATGEFLSKVRVSGGGRCNVTHACFDAGDLTKHYPRGGKELRGPFSRFQASDTVAWFTERGVALKTEEDNRIFPESDKSQTIIECILSQAAQLGIKSRSKVRVESIALSGPELILGIKEGESLRARSVLLATGGSKTGHALAQQLGHSITALAPSLFTFEIKHPLLDDLAGISFPESALTLRCPAVFRESGPALITHWGLSGPGVLRLSAWAARELAEADYQAELSVSWLPMAAEECRSVINNYRECRPQQKVAANPALSLPKRFWERLCSLSGISTEMSYAALSNSARDNIVDLVCASSLRISGKGVFKEEFVTCGGVDCREVNFKTLESRLCPRLFFAGEVLDIDGETGGFNFQNAWTTGWHAGSAIQERIHAGNA